MSSVAEGGVPADVAMDVKAIGILEATLVPIGRGHHEEQSAARGHRLLVELDVLELPTCDMGPRWLVAQQFFDRIGDEGAVLGQLSALVRVLGQYLPHPSEQVSGGLDACAGDDGEKDEDLLLAQVAHGARLILELNREEFGDEVIGGIFLPPSHVLCVLVGVEVFVLS